MIHLSTLTLTIALTGLAIVLVGVAILRQLCKIEQAIKDIEKITISATIHTAETVTRATAKITKLCIN